MKSRETMWAKNVTQVKKERNACNILVGKPEGKRH
jgi:hypothetical protein